jgi:hypothetical protein
LKPFVRGSHIGSQVSVSHDHQVKCGEFHLSLDQAGDGVRSKLIFLRHDQMNHPVYPTRLTVTQNTLCPGWSYGKCGHFMVISGIFKVHGRFQRSAACRRNRKGGLKVICEDDLIDDFEGYSRLDDLFHAQ